jgi:putative membrane protein
MWHVDDGMGWWMVFGGLFWLVTLALLGYLFVALLSPAREPREPREPPPPAARRESPLEVAQRRYAGGEITREEFARIRDDLAGGPPAAG